MMAYNVITCTTPLPLHMLWLLYHNTPCLLNGTSITTFSNILFTYTYLHASVKWYCVRHFWLPALWNSLPCIDIVKSLYTRYLHLFFWFIANSAKSSIIYIQFSLATLLTNCQHYVLFHFLSFLFLEQWSSIIIIQQNYANLNHLVTQNILLHHRL